MYCGYCQKQADDFDRICGAFKPSQLPDGQLRYTCPTCIDLILADHYIREDELYRFDTNGDLLAG